MKRWLHQTGRGVRVAIIDSGIHARHPHVGGIAGGAAMSDGDEPVADTTDRLGHGYAVKVFELTLSTTAERRVRVKANLKGISFAVANMSGVVARVREDSPAASARDVVRILAASRSFS